MLAWKSNVVGIKKKKDKKTGKKNGCSLHLHCSTVSLAALANADQSATQKKPNASIRGRPSFLRMTRLMCGLVELHVLVRIIRLLCQDSVPLCCMSNLPIEDHVLFLERPSLISKTPSHHVIQPHNPLNQSSIPSLTQQ